MTDEIVIEAGELRMAVDARGRIVSLSDAATGAEHIHSRHASHILMMQLHGDKERRAPIGCRRVEGAAGRKGAFSLELKFEGGGRARVDVSPGDDYVRMTLAEVTPLDEIELVSWGPYRTTMREPLAEFLGLVRSGDFTVGLLSLEPNTDGQGGGALFVAHHLGYEGSYLEALSHDHTRDGVGRKGIAIRGVPGVTVEGSSVALFGCRPDRELDVVEKVELGEELPHPALDGVWMKRSRDVARPSLWTGYDERNADECIELARRMGALTMVRFHGTAGNWGHFETDLKLFPGGARAERAVAERARAAGVDMVTYTLTTFTKARTAPEPYVTPVPDPRLQTILPHAELVAGVDESAREIVLTPADGVAKAFDGEGYVRIDNEFIGYKECGPAETRVTLRGCERGSYGTRPARHDAGSVVKRMLHAGYKNFYPGTLDLQDEMAQNIARAALEGGSSQVTLDGYESCLETGHGAYAKNRLITTIFEACDRRMRFSGSNFGNYDWHLMTYISWGEWDLAKGFRGTMLDYRLMRQIQLERNHMPHRMGQYYPADATLEDVEWLMARAAGFDAGVDFHVDPDKIAENPERDAILDAIRLWDEARMARAFDERERLGLRQTDRLYTLSRDPNGKWDLRFLRWWKHEGAEILPPSAFDVAPLASGAASVRACSIDFARTHNPAIYAAAGLSDDLVHRSGATPTEWKVRYPDREGARDDRLLFVMRLAPDAPCAVRNPTVTLDGKWRVEVPATLEPGQYLSTTHDMPLVSIYDRGHEVIGEAHARHVYCQLPAVKRGAPHRIAVSVEPLERGATPEVIVNLRTQFQIAK